jgi:hypothetical protein
VGIEKLMQKAATKCHKKIESKVATGQKTTKSGKKPSCATKGTWKHKCCKDYLERRFQGRSDVKCEATFKKQRSRLDVAIIDSSLPPPSVKKIYDFKFNCSSGPKMSRTQEQKYNKQRG